MSGAMLKCLGPEIEEGDQTLTNVPDTHDMLPVVVGSREV